MTPGRHNLTREWEKSLFGAAVAVCVLYLVLMLAGFGERKLRFGGADPVPPSVNLLNSLTAWDFLVRPDEVQQAERPTDAFAFTPHFRPIQVKTVEPPVVPVVPPKDPPKVDVRPPAKVYTTLQYGGFLTTPTNPHKVAMVQNVNTHKTFYLEPAQSFDGFTVVGFDDTQIEIKTPAGETTTIAAGQRKSFEKK